MKPTMTVSLTNRKQIGQQMHTKPKSPVKLSNETDPAKAKRIDPANMHRKSNVNVAQGPRTGNTSARAGKRAEFIDMKEDRAPIADIIVNAYKARGDQYKMKTTEKSGSIMPDVKPQRFKK
jgi:hypothetical protein